MPYGFKKEKGFRLNKITSEYTQGTHPGQMPWTWLIMRGEEVMCHPWMC